MNLADRDQNASDGAFQLEMLDLLHQGVRLSTTAQSQCQDPQVVCLARDEALTEVHQLSCLISTLSRNGSGGATAREAAPLHQAPSRGHSEDLERACLSAVPACDTVFLRQLSAHHLAIVERAGRELREGFNAAERRFAEQMIAAHFAGLDRLKGIAPLGPRG